MKLITFSLWGTDLKYLVGAQKNADLAAKIYPEWVCRFYVAESVPYSFVADHPWHKYHVLGGMWGTKKGTLPDMKELINSFAQQDAYGTDYQFFTESIFPRIEHDCLIHDEFFTGNPFPSPRDGLKFVGQVFDENDETVLEHLEVLRKHIG
jgi:hypothetical protein